MWTKKGGIQDSLGKYLRNLKTHDSGHWCLTPAILATQEAEIMRITV
jgi:hypothetical protein